MQCRYIATIHIVIVLKKKKNTNFVTITYDSAKFYRHQNYNYDHYTLIETIFTHVTFSYDFVVIGPMHLSDIFTKSAVFSRRRYFYLFFQTIA